MKIQNCAFLVEHFICIRKNPVWRGWDEYDQKSNPSDVPDAAAPRSETKNHRLQQNCMKNTFCTCSLSQNPECLILYSHHALLLSGGERIELKIAHVHHLLAAGRPFPLSHFWAKLIAVPLAKSQQKLKTPSSRRESVFDSVTELHAPPNNLDTDANYPAS